MNPQVQNIIADLDGISSIEDELQLEKLEDIVRGLSCTVNSELVVNALLRVFERFPSGDAYGLFWSILSVLESIPNYELCLLESIKRQPSEFGLLMINSILNSGRVEVSGESLLSLLKDVAANEQQPEELRNEARGFIEWQKNRVNDRC
ncbi:MAG: hypothetical protein ACJ741_05415 [Pyrinomonadaceae bacterium]